MTGPAPATKRARPVPPIGLATLAVVTGAAFSLNLALQSRLNSVATLIGVLLVGALLLAEPARRRLTVYAPLAMVVAAAAIGVVRASPWVTAPAYLLAAVGLVVAGQDRLLAATGPLRTGVNYLLDLADTPRWLTGPLRRLAPGRQASPSVIRGLALAAVALVPLVMLLAAADAVFGQLILSLFQEGFWRHFSITLMAAVPLAAVVLGGRRHGRPDRPTAVTPRFSSMTEGTIVLGAVALLLSAWGATQVLVAVGGAERLLATADLTAAENARRGFFPLVAVTGLLIAVVVGVDRYTTRTDDADRRRFLGLTALIGLETVGVVAATYSRLALYIHGFGHTMLRLAVAWFLAFLAVAMVVLVVGMNRRSIGVNRAGGLLFVVAGLWVVAFGAFNPEAFVAGRNLDGAVTGAAFTRGKLDERYLLRDLGADAVPTIVAQLDRLDEPTADRLRAELCSRSSTTPAFGPAGWNRADAAAADAIATLNCP